MLQTGNWEQLSTAAQNTVMEGALAYHALKHEHHDYNHWLKVGKAIVELRRAASEQAGVSPNSLKHPAYRAAYKRLISSEKAGELGELDSSTSTHAAWLANNLANVEAWRATLDSKTRISLNHPTAVWRKHPDGRRAEQADKVLSLRPAERKNVTRDLNSAVDRLSDTVDLIESKTAGAEMFDMSPELIGESAKNFIEIFGADDTKRFVAALQTILAPPAVAEAPVKPPRVPRKRQSRAKAEPKS
jgi:hypothetical protein